MALLTMHAIGAVRSGRLGGNVGADIDFFSREVRGPLLKLCWMVRTHGVAEPANRAPFSKENRNEVASFPQIPFCKAKLDWMLMAIQWQQAALRKSEIRKPARIYSQGAGAHCRPESLRSSFRVTNETRASPHLPRNDHRSAWKTDAATVQCPPRNSLNANGCNGAGHGSLLSFGSSAVSRWDGRTGGSVLNARSCA